MYFYVFHSLAELLQIKKMSVCQNMQWHRTIHLTEFRLVITKCHRGGFSGQVKMVPSVAHLVFRWEVLIAGVKYDGSKDGAVLPNGNVFRGRKREQQTNTNDY